MKSQFICQFIIIRKIVEILSHSVINVYKIPLILVYILLFLFDLKNFFWHAITCAMHVEKFNNFHLKRFLWCYTSNYLLAQDFSYFNMKALSLLKSYKLLPILFRWMNFKFLISLHSLV